MHACWFGCLLSLLPTWASCVSDAPSNHLVLQRYCAATSVQRSSSLGVTPAPVARLALAIIRRYLSSHCALVCALTFSSRKGSASPQPM
ncbi:hypothetical protein ALP53_200033 [Pseudomonas savastanoi pv. phaseolicola]|nr:hypothetical protein ALP53_200033 [Pseudomonas savastanoi pv. phaseolicola]